MYALYVDSAADLPHRFFEEYDIRVIPMDYSINDQSFTFYTNAPDHDEICARMYRAQREGADVHTSQISPYRYVEIWTPELQNGVDILYLSFSSGMSATYENALTAAKLLQKDFPERTVEIVDSLSATAGQGVLTIAAAQNRQAGMSLAENAQWLRENAKYICHRFVAGDLDYLHKGGRVSGAVAVIGSALHFKPLLIIDDEGKLQVVGKARGMQQAMKALVQGYAKEQGVQNDTKWVLISHSDDPEGSERLKHMVEAVAQEGTRVETVCLSPVIGAHTGTQHLSVCGWGLLRMERK